MIDLQQIVNKIKSGQFDKKDLERLSSFIKSYTSYNFKLIKKEDLEDFVSDVITSFIQSIINPNSNIDNYEAYLKTIIRNQAQRQELNHEEVLQLIRITRGILDELENNGKINSYENRKYCLNGFHETNYSRDEILNKICLYDFTQINLETRWTQKRKDLIANFIIALLQDVKCIEFNTLIDVLKTKLGMKVIEYEIEQETEDDNQQDIFENEISINNQEENHNVIKEYSEKYKSNLKKFIEENPKRNKKILKTIYYYYFEKKTLQEIAKILSYSSPTTIQIYLKNNENLSPSEFIKTLSLIDEEINNHFQFLYQLENELLDVLNQVYREIDDDASISEGEKQ